MQFRCPNCQQPIQIAEESPIGAEAETVNTVECPSCHSEFNLSGDSGSTLFATPGMKIGHFEVEELLGEGSFGTVFKAWDAELRRHVAMKVPRQGRITKETSKLFLREARAAAGISHPNIVSVYEIGQHEDSFYIASELIDGITLSEYLRHHTLQPMEAAKLVIKLLRGVQVFHDKGIIHRDLKPGNILMDSGNEPHISDFGLARSEDQTELTVTHTGKIIGTLLYMPPEQARGDNRNLSARCDIYAMGVILYELLTGQRPFKSTSSRTLLYSILSDPPPQPRKLKKSIPRDLETICLKALEKDPLRRFNSAGEMADDLQRFVDQKPILSRPISSFERSWRMISRHLVVSALSLLLILLLLTVVYQFSKPPSPDSVRLTHQVVLGCRLSGNSVPPNAKADWTILPLHKRTREPVEEKAIRIADAAELTLALEPGEYLVIAYVKGFGFHEVYRRVPEDPSAVIQGRYPHERWETEKDGKLVLPPVVIRAEADVVDGMVQVPGGTFEMGDGEPTRLRHQREVQPFYVDSHEVTAEDFLQFGALEPGYKLPRDAHAVTVHWNAATAYAEFVGKRLLKEHEFEYLARDLGASNYPGGSDPAVAAGESWIYPVAGEPATDRLKDLPVFGIHSNVAEWTDSLLNLYPGEPDPGPERERIMNLQENRVVRGGPVTAGPNDRSLNTWNSSVSHRAAWDVRTMDNEIGFRCCRSAQPRFQK